MRSNLQTIRVFEEYRSPTEKRAAQRGAKMGKPTGKTDSFLFVFPPMGDGKTWGMGGNFFPATPTSMANTGIGRKYLQGNCRRVGKKYLPPHWAAYLKQLMS